MDTAKYRHEFKYIIDEQQLRCLEDRAKYIMKSDSHANENTYNVRSLYFDNYYNSCFYDNEDGNDPREKFRIRIYNGSKDRISLECKRKENNKTLKTACLITEEQCQKLMNGKLITDVNSEPLINKINLKILNEMYHPVIIVDYDRRPYIDELGNVRVTFDTHISSSVYLNKFLDKEIPKRPVMPIGTQLLEVKYDEFLLDEIYNNLELEELAQTAFSKYYYCRCYEMGMICFNRK